MSTSNNMVKISMQEQQHTLCIRVDRIAKWIRDGPLTDFKIDMIAIRHFSKQISFETQALV